MIRICIDRKHETWWRRRRDLIYLFFFISICFSFRDPLLCFYYASNIALCLEFSVYALLCEKGQFHLGQKSVQYFSFNLDSSFYLCVDCRMARKEMEEKVVFIGNKTAKVNSILNTFRRRCFHMWTVEIDFYIQFRPLAFMSLIPESAPSEKRTFPPLFITEKFVRQLRMSRHVCASRIEFE